MNLGKKGPVGWVSRLWRWASHSAFLVGLVSLIWFVARTGTKPSRAAYPCQRAAAVNGSAWLAAYVIPFLPFARSVKLRPLDRQRVAGCLLAVVLVVAVGWAAQMITTSFLGSAAGNQVVQLTLSGARAQHEPASDLFVVNGVPAGDCGVPELIALMSQAGAHFYRSDEPEGGAGPDGLIAADDVVLIKVNCQWDKRGGTNTDLLRALIQAIVDHPDGFTGEIVVADNGQAQYGSTGRGGSFDYARNNAEDPSQSVRAVVDSFLPAHNVSAYLWDTITTSRVDEYEQGDDEDGYVVGNLKSPTTGAIAAYPKFRTEFGTYVSFKMGIWNPEQETYDSDRLKVLNVPVLKTHLIYGVTGCVKHYMGVTSDKLTSRAGARAHDRISYGGMGTEIVETRFPTLNILDAIWVNAVPAGGPGTSYERATRTDVIAASVDPVALDAWAAKHVLIQAAELAGRSRTSSMDPSHTSSSRSSFANWLRRSMEEIVNAGHQATVDEDRMNVYVTDL